MNSFKPGNVTVTYRPLNIRGALLMSASLFIGFSLIDGKAVNEQELWVKLAPLLGGSPLDEGLPKARGEFLVAGSCHAPKGKTLSRAEVIVQVGKREKHLAVFGERVWRRGGLGMTEPQAFTSMSLSWEHSFGDGQYAANPLGRGIIPDTCPRDAIITLPNVEYFNDLIVDSYDRPRPAAMLPVLPHWAPRASRAGTYDQEWKKNRWPWFPDDVDPNFFNVASEDQQFAGFFEGGEAVHIRGMHPEYQDIHCTVPMLRPRCFATVKKDPKAAAEHDTFREVGIRADTLWLFPDSMTGVLIYHGTTPVRDEEFDDVRYFFAVMEDAAAPPAPLEEYLEQQWIKAAEVTPNFFGRELTLKEAQAVMQKIWLQKAMGKLERNSKLALRQSPQMPFSEVRVRALATKPFASMRRQLDKSLKELDAMLSGEDGKRWRKRLISQRDKLYIKERRTVHQVDSGLSAQHEKLLQMAASMPGHIPAGSLDDMVRTLQKQKSINPWHDRGFPIVAKCRERLEMDDACIAALEGMHLSLTTTDFTWLGFLGAPFDQRPEDWGLPPGETFTIPSGLVMPRFDGETLTRISILQGWTPQLTPEETAGLPALVVPGSDTSPLFFDSPNPGAPVVITPGELEAWIVDEALGGMCSVLALPYSPSGPDVRAADSLSDLAKKLLSEARALIVLLPQGARTTKSDLMPWRALHSNPILVRLPERKTVLRPSSSILMGIDRLIQAHLSPDTLGVSNEDLAGNGVDPTLAAERAIKDNMNKIVLARIDKIEAELAHMPAEANIRAHMEKARRKVLYPEEFKHEKESSNPKVQLRKQRNTLTQQEKLFQENGIWTPEAEKAFQDAFFKIDAATVTLDATNAALLEGFGAPPSTARKPEDEEVPDAFTREDVVRFARNGISLEGQDISGLDLSGLDLSGVCLSFASMNESNFQGADLSGAVLACAQIGSADFTSANLAGATLQTCTLISCNFAGAILDKAILKQATFNKCDCSQASFRDAEFYMATLMDCSLAGTVFDGASFMLSSLSGRARGASFQQSTHMQTGFASMELDRANFTRANVGSIRMFDCTGEGLIFYEADMEGAMLHQCIFPKADFRRAKMIRGAISQTELADADFTGSILIGSRIDKSELKKAQIYGVNASECMFFKSDLEGADLRGSSFISASFSGSRLVSCNMRLANCFGADFRRAVFGETLMEGVILRNTLLEGREDLL